MNQLINRARFIRDCYAQGWTVAKNHGWLVITPVLIFFFCDSLVYLPARLSQGQYSPGILQDYSIVAIANYVLPNISYLASSRALMELTSGFRMGAGLLAFAFCLLQIPLIFFYQYRLKRTHKYVMVFLWTWLAIALYFLPHLGDMWRQRLYDHLPIPSNGGVVFHDLIGGLYIVAAMNLCALPFITALEAILITSAGQAILQNNDEDLFRKAFSRFWLLLGFNFLLLILSSGCDVIRYRMTVWPVPYIHFFQTQSMEAAIQAFLFGVPFFIVLSDKNIIGAIIENWDLIKQEVFNYGMWLISAYILLLVSTLLAYAADRIQELHTWIWPFLWYPFKSAPLIAAVWLYLAFLAFARRRLLSAFLNPKTAAANP